MFLQLPAWYVGTVHSLKSNSLVLWNLKFFSSAFSLSVSSFTVCPIDTLETVNDFRKALKYCKAETLRNSKGAILWAQVLVVLGTNPENSWSDMMYVDLCSQWSASWSVLESNCFSIADGDGVKQINRAILWGLKNVRVEQ